MKHSEGTEVRNGGTSYVLSVFRRVVAKYETKYDAPYVIRGVLRTSYRTTPGPAVIL